MTERGAYGLRIRGVCDARVALVHAKAGWPPLRVLAERGDPPVAPERVTGDRAEIVLKTGGRLTVDRHDGTARYLVPRPLSDDELIHPFLAPAAAVMAHWLGRLSFHAGAFVAGGGVWGVVGDRESGKSSTLAWLALEGHEIVADDILVLEHGAAYAGPRSIDLRHDAAQRLGVGTALGVVGTRPRWRVGLPQVRDGLPLRGWIFLGWSTEPQARRLSGSQCLTRLVAHIGLRRTGADPVALLELATLPAWDFQRPKDWNRTRESMQRLLAVTR